MDDKPVRVKQELCDNEGEKGEILPAREFVAEEATTTAAFGVKREMEGMIKEETEFYEFGDGDEIVKDEDEFYEFGDGDEIVKDEDEESVRGTDEERRSNE